MMLRKLIKDLNEVLDDKGDIEVVFLNHNGEILRCNAVVGQPLDQESASWGIDSCVFSLD